MLLGHPALRLLARLKLRAWLRSTRRRLMTPSGLVFGLLGFGFMGLWIGSLFLRTSWMDRPAPAGPQLLLLTQGGIALLALLAGVSSLGHRGIYFPKAELERLLSAPLSRGDLVRHRLWVTLCKSLFFSLIMAWFFSRRMPNPAFGFAGALVTLCTLPLFGQAVALLAGDAENRFARLVKRLPFASLRVVVGLGFWLFLMVFLFADQLSERFPGFFDDEHGPASWLALPLSSALLAPFTPWAKAMLASDWRSFLTPFAAIVGLWVVLFELVAHLPVDFRELSLETSADVARRLNRLRHGRGTQGDARLKRGGFGWHVPWLFGRGPFGAIAWLQSCGIIRKARGTLVFSILITGLITVLTTVGGGLDAESPVVNSAFVAGMATLYLGWGLRFDFRSSLDTLAAIKAWPVPAWKIFLATLLPEVCLVSFLASLAVLVQALASGHFAAASLLVIAGNPLLALLWFALDNALFLLAPVRFTPGQGGTMQHTGRQMVLVFLRTLVLVCLAGAAVGLGFLVAHLADGAGWAEPLTLAVAIASTLLLLGLFLVSLIAFGGWTLRRFDVARAI